MPKHIDALRRSVECGDIADAGVHIHKIKGASANLGGIALSSAAGRMEEAANMCKLNEMASMMPELERQYQLLIEQLQSL